MRLSYLFLGQSFNRNLTIIAIVMVTHHKIPIRATLLNHIQPRHLLRLHQRPLHGITICSNEKRSTLANSSIKLLISHKSNLYNKSFLLTENPPLECSFTTLLSNSFQWCTICIFIRTAYRAAPSHTLWYATRIRLFTNEWASPSTLLIARRH